ncbi:MAG: hypothetical protein MI974_24430 [Chitinophagales bacterium]|nr:hypothetical protein [Chitinophagales bacterium]
MNIIKILLVVCYCFLAHVVFGQAVNWANNSLENKHTVHLNIGWDYGLIYELGYSYQLDSEMPIILNALYSFPSGEDFFDDFKIKLGGQMSVLEHGPIGLSLAVNGIYRRYENPLTTLQNFGGEIATAIGYYKPRWFIAAELGFDKAIATHFNHTDAYRENIYSEVKDGWYNPSTGGNFHFGVQTALSFSQNAFVFRIGRMATENFNTTPTIPYYMRLGYQRKF